MNPIHRLVDRAHEMRDSLMMRFRWLRHFRHLRHLKHIKRVRLRVAFAVFILALVIVPPLSIELGCRHVYQPKTVENADPVTISDPAYRKPETGTYLNYPLWLIVKSYGDLAASLKRGDENSFSHFGAIGDYWGGFCSMNRLATADGGGSMDEKATLYVAGVAYTLDMGVRGVYENTIGRITGWWRGANPTKEDFLADAVSDTYATYLTAHPWYNFPFTGALGTLWYGVSFDTSNIVRASERRLALSTGWGLEAGAAAITKLAYGYSPIDSRVGLVVKNMQPGDLGSDEHGQVIRRLRSDLTYVRVPADELTDVVGRLSLKSRSLVEIAGNQSIMVTVLQPTGVLQVPAGATFLFVEPLRYRPGLRRVGFEVRVPDLMSVLAQLKQQESILEHISSD